MEYGSVEMSSIIERHLKMRLSTLQSFGPIAVMLRLWYIGPGESATLIRDFDRKQHNHSV